MKAWFPFIVLSILTALLVWWSRDFILFWDTVQFAGKHGLWYYEQGIFSGILPEQLDSGHPPFFGMYQAAMWKLFGKSLSIASFVMLPFLFLNIYFGLRCGKLILEDRAWLFPLAMLTSPFYLGHSILISPDIILVTGFLMALYGVLARKRRFIYAGTILLCLISLRGFAVAAALFLYQALDLYQQKEKYRNILRKCLSLFGPAFLLFILYQVFHWTQTRWIGFHDDSPWSGSFGIVDLQTVLRNTLVFGWRLTDYGMLLVYLIIAYFLLFKKQWADLLSLLLILLLIFGLLIIPFHGLLNHRYFIPIQLVSMLLILHYLKNYKLLFSTLLIAILALGNCVIYPDKIAQGWDVTAAHWPIYNLEKELSDYLVSDKDLSFSEIGTAFPLRVDRQYLDLVSDTKGYHKYDMTTDKYILYSNIMNEFSDQDLERLQKWRIIKELKSGGIRLVLYSRE